MRAIGMAGGKRRDVERQPEMLDDGAMSGMEWAVGGYAPPPGSGMVVAGFHDGVSEIAAFGAVDAGSVFELGSVTKVVTGLLLADAVVSGQFSLDTPLAEALPGAHPRGPITLGELASHTSGLPRVPLALLWGRGGRLDDPYAQTTVGELLEHLRRARVRGTGRMRYSNFGAALLGQALAADLGKPYERLVHDRILGPLGVQEVWAEGGPPVVQPHDRRGREVSPWTLGAYAPAGCLHGTARGALSLAVACLDPPAGMAAAVALALTPRVHNKRIACGLGWMSSPLASDAQMWWHNGGTLGSRSFIAFVPHNRTAIAALTNSARPPDQDAIGALTALGRQP